MSTNVKWYIGIGATVLLLVGVSFASYHLYHYGYQQGFSECEAHYVSELEKVKQVQSKEQERVSELEQQLYDASKKYEDLNSSLSAVQKENEKWKAQANDAQKEALVPSTVRRINEILKTYSSQ